LHRRAGGADASRSAGAASKSRRTHGMKTVHLHAMVLMGILLAGCATTPTPTSANLQLSIPENATDRDYLGLSQGTANFRLEEIRCEVLVIDCFDMGAVASAYGVLRRDGTAEHALFMIDKQGIIRYIDVHDINEPASA